MNIILYHLRKKWTLGGLLDCIVSDRGFGPPALPLIFSVVWTCTDQDTDLHYVHFAEIFYTEQMHGLRRVQTG